MKSVLVRIGVVGAALLLAGTAFAQDYRARVQGQITDESRGALPGVSVTLVNDATGVSGNRVTDAEGRYRFDFVEPGSYGVSAELQGFHAAGQKAVRVSQRGDVTVDLVMNVATVEETITVQASSVLVQFNSSSSDLTLERQLVDQVPISGRNPYSLANLDPSIVNTPGTTAAENRPYHHAYANDYDAGGGTRRANEVLLDGVPLSASYKTSYTPVDGCDRGNHRLEEQRRRRERQQPRRSDQPQHEVGHQRAARLGLHVRPRSEHELDQRPDHSHQPRTGHVGTARHQAADVRRHRGRADQDEQDLQLHRVRAVERPAAR